MSNNSPKVYVGTYGKYSSGSIKGDWLELENYADKEAFLEACAELHKDESDPEFMFQDFENIPKGLVGESYIDESVWDWLELDDDDRELLAVYQEHIDESGDIDRAREAFSGKWDSELDWAYDWIEQTDSLHGASEFMARYFDYESFLNDCKCGGDIYFVYHDSDYWAFNRNL